MRLIHLGRWLFPVSGLRCQLIDRPRTRPDCPFPASLTRILTLAPSPPQHSTAMHACFFQSPPFLWYRIFRGSLNRYDSLEACIMPPADSIIHVASTPRRIGCVFACTLAILSFYFSSWNPLEQSQRVPAPADYATPASVSFGAFLRRRENCSPFALTESIKGLFLWHWNSGVQVSAAEAKSEDSSIRQMLREMHCKNVQGKREQWKSILR